MAHSTSTTTTSVHDLINNLATFALAAGWTVERNTLSGTNRTLTLKRAETDYIHVFNTSQDRILLRGSTGFDAGAVPSAQPGASPGGATVSRVQGPYPKVWFFADGPEVVVVVRRGDQNSAYASFAFGALAKYGTYSGGTYFDGTYFDQVTGGSSGRWQNQRDHGLLAYGVGSSGYVRADADAVGQWHRIGEDALVQSGPLVAANAYTTNQTAAVFSVARLIGAADDNVFSGRSMLYPVELTVRRAGSPAYFSPVGASGLLRAASLAKFAPEDELSIASETWALFPTVSKRAQSDAVDAPQASDNVGFAVRKVD